jgi:hypothetical protein
METKKRVYIGLLLSSMILVAVLAGCIWYIISHQGIMLSKLLLIAVVIVFGLIFAVLGIGILAIIVMIIRSKDIPALKAITNLANDVLFPLTMITGRFLGINREKILSSYIAVNNYLVKTKKLLLPGEQVMILLPHCLQDVDCPHKITMDINNCKKCGKCCISSLIELGDRYHAKIKVATGGTLARKFIKDCRPQGVVAVACERDLSMGIQESGQLPVLGCLTAGPTGHVSIPA